MTATMTIGFDQPLYILPFDQRESFQTKMFGWKGGCIVLGGGEDEHQVREWLATAASVAGFVGFAVGRTTFWDALVDWRANRITREAAVAEIARRYREWVDIFEKCALLPAETVGLTRQALRRWENEGGHR